MATFHGVAGVAMLVRKAGTAIAYDNGNWVPVPAAFADAGAKMTKGQFEACFPQIDMESLFDIVSENSAFALLTKVNRSMAETAEDPEEVDYRFDIWEQSWQEF